MSRHIWFDAPPLLFLGRMVPVSSPCDSASAVSDTCPGAAAGSSAPVIASIILLAVIVAEVGDSTFQQLLRSAVKSEGTAARNPRWLFHSPPSLRLAVPSLT